MKEVKHIEAFYNWYMPIRLPGSTWETFTQLNLKFRLGFYLVYLSIEGFDFVIGSDYYAITRHGKSLVVEPELSSTGVEDIYTTIINYCFNLIENPF